MFNLKMLNLPVNPWEKQADQSQLLKTKVFEVLSHILPNLKLEQVGYVRRLKGDSPNVGHANPAAHENTSTNSRGIPPVLIRLSDSNLVQIIL